jgi:hypothetical protein
VEGGALAEIFDVERHAHGHELVHQPDVSAGHRSMERHEAVRVLAGGRHAPRHELAEETLISCFIGNSVTM